MKNQIKLMLAAVALVGFQAQAQNLVQNPGFETGDFTDWTLTGNTGFTSVASGNQYVHSGTYGGQFGAVGSDGFLSQALSSGSSLYDVSFWLYDDGGGPNENFTASLGGVTLFGLSSPGIDGGFPYTESLPSGLERRSLWEVVDFA
jgi:hypothetical protein